MNPTKSVKNTRGQLDKCGYEDIISLPEFNAAGFLSSNVAQHRTAAARYMRIYPDQSYLPLLCRALENEKKLYAKIEICETLAFYGEPALEYLVAVLGRIGGNQHTEPVNCDLSKKSYPLPRDIAARTIIRIGTAALPRLIAALGGADEKIISEAIDAIGHISFTAKDTSARAALIKLYEQSPQALIEWKLVRAFQAFGCDEVKTILEAILSAPEKDEILKNEARRSLARISARYAR